jgi:ribosomal protein S24E
LDVKIVDERANPLLHRKEYTFEVDHAGAATPPRTDVRKELAKLVKVPADRLIIERMNARFGTAKTRGEAMAYATKEALDVTVREHILIRNGLREKAAPAAPGAGGDAPTTEAPKGPPAAAPEKPEPAREEAPKEPAPAAHPKAAHSKPEHPRAEHPKDEHAKAEHQKPEHAKPEHSKAEGHPTETPKESHKGGAHKSDKAEKGGAGEKPEKHEGKGKASHETKKEE